MLGTMRQSWLLFTLVALFALSSALSIEEALHIDGIEAYLHHGVKRQGTGTGDTATPNATPTSGDDSSSNTPTPTSTPTPTPTPTEDSSTPPPPPSSTPPPSSAPPTTDDNQPSSQAPSSSPPSQTQPPVTSTKITTPVIKTTPLVSTSVSVYLTVYTTVSNGQNVVLTSQVSSTALVTTGQATHTDLPDPQPDNGNSSGGLSDSKKKIIGGVVGGVGGAILLGGLAIVAWRIWGRKNRVSEDDADLMAGTGSALGDKPQNGTSPFQSNLEQYHNPGGRPNAAANF